MTAAERCIREGQERAFLRSGGPSSLAGRGGLVLELADTLPTSTAPGVSMASLAVIFPSLTQAPSVAPGGALPIFPRQAPTAPIARWDFGSSLGCCPRCALHWRVQERQVLRAVLSGVMPSVWVSLGLCCGHSCQAPISRTLRSLPGSTGCQDSPGVPHRSPEPGLCLLTDVHCAS